MSFENYIKAVHQIDARLQYHSVEGSGRILDGVFYDRAKEVQPMGVSQLPFVQPFDWGDEEEAGVAGGSVDANCGNSANVAYKHTMSLTYMVGARKNWGWFAQDTTDIGLEASDTIDPKYIEGGLGIMQVVARVKDAIETTADVASTYDGSLGGLLFRPMSIAVRENFNTDQSACVILEVQLEMEAECRGKRSLPSGEPDNHGVDGEGGYAEFGTGAIVQFPAITSSNAERIKLEFYATHDIVKHESVTGVIELNGADNSALHFGKDIDAIGKETVVFRGVDKNQYTAIGTITIEQGFHTIELILDGDCYQFYLDGVQQAPCGGPTIDNAYEVTQLRIGLDNAGNQPDFGLVRFRVWDGAGPLMDVSPPAVGADLDDETLWVDAVSGAEATLATGVTWGDA